MHDRNIRARLIAALEGTLFNAAGVDARRLPRPVRPLANRRFLNGLVPAAVLIGVVDDPQRLSILLTERCANMRNHAGQISFPGGRQDDSDRNTLHTAMREACEEINLTADMLTPIGQLGEYPTVTGFRVTPIVAMVNPAAIPNLRPSPAEVESIIHMPLRHILHPQHFSGGWLQRGSLRVPYKSVAWRGQRVWGATAAMLSELSTQVRAIRL